MASLKRNGLILASAFIAVLSSGFVYMASWESKFVQQKNGALKYTPDEKGNVIPDFSRVGFYKGDKPIPEIAVVTTINPSANALQEIQSAIDALSQKPLDKNGFRGAILLKKGTYDIPGTIFIRESGIVLRGEGQQTKLVALAASQKPLISVSGIGNLQETGTHAKIIDKYVPTGAFSFTVSSTEGFKAGDD